MVNDAIADFLVQLKNASKVRKGTVSVPYSRVTHAIAEVLAREGYVGEVARRTKTRKIDVALRYEDGRPRISGGTRISKPSRRVYLGARDIRPVKRGRGLLILSTPKGIKTGKEAREERIGGEVLFELW